MKSAFWFLRTPHHLPPSSVAPENTSSVSSKSAQGYDNPSLWNFSGKICRSLFAIPLPRQKVCTLSSPMMNSMPWTPARKKRKTPACHRVLAQKISVRRKQCIIRQWPNFTEESIMHCLISRNSRPGRRKVWNGKDFSILHGAPTSIEKHSHLQRTSGGNLDIRIKWKKFNSELNIQACINLKN